MSEKATFSGPVLAVLIAGATAVFALSVIADAERLVRRYQLQHDHEVDLGHRTCRAIRIGPALRYSAWTAAVSTAWWLQARVASW